jgi:hypothetical protein
MRTTLLFLGDEFGLREPKEPVEVTTPRYRGPTGQKAQPDPQFVDEMIRRRSALKLSAVALGRETPFSCGYIAMVESGARCASEEAKQAIRNTLDRLEHKT